MSETNTITTKPAKPWHIVNSGNALATSLEALVRLRRSPPLDLIASEIIPERELAKAEFLADGKVSRFRELCGELEEAEQHVAEFSAKAQAAADRCAEIAVLTSGEELHSAQLERDGAAQDLADVIANRDMLRRAAESLQASLVTLRANVETKYTGAIHQSGLAAQRDYTNQIALLISDLLDAMAIARNRTERSKINLPTITELIGSLPAKAEAAPPSAPRQLDREIQPEFAPAGA